MQYQPHYAWLTNVCLNLTDACNLACRYCLTGDTIINLKDGTGKPIKDIHEGDIILGCEEDAPGDRKQRTILESTVLKTSSRQVNSILEIEFNDGKILHITDNHPVLNGRGKWTQAKNLRENTGMVMSIRTVPNRVIDIYNPDYIKGYFLGMWLTDGSHNAYEYDTGIMYRMRLAVKDDEIISRMKEYCDFLNFDYTIRDFVISEKENLSKPAIFSSKQTNFDFINNLQSQLPQDIENPDYLRGFVAACYDAEGHIDKDNYTLSISNSDPIILDTWEKGLAYFGFNYIRDLPKVRANLPISRSRLLTDGSPTLAEQIRFFNTFSPAVARKTYYILLGSHPYFRNTIKSIKTLSGDFTVYNLETSTHTYLANGCVVHNCFVEQHPHYMTLDTAKEVVKWELDNHRRKTEAGITKNKHARVVFFGGEPMLCYDSIIVPLVEWIEKEYPDSLNLSMTTNGTLLTPARIQWLHDHNIGLLLSIDGAAETQNYNRPCRNGENSLDLILPNLPTLLHYYPYITFRSTIYKDTVEHTFENFAFAASLGFKNIFMTPNCREVWSQDKLDILSQECEKIYNYFIASMRNEVPFLSNSRIKDSFIEVLLHDLDVKSGNFKCQENLLRHVERCGLGTGMGSVGYDGNIYGCQEQTSRDEKNIFLIGNIFEGGINQERHLKLLETYRHGGRVHCVDESQCVNCPLQSQCYSKACPSTTWDMFNSFDTFPQVYCAWLKMQFFNAARAMKILVDENNERFKHYLDNQCGFKNYFDERGDD